jgi:hypothetical protein
VHHEQCIAAANEREWQVSNQLSLLSFAASYTNAIRNRRFRIERQLLDASVRAQCLVVWQHTHAYLRLQFSDLGLQCGIGCFEILVFALQLRYQPTVGIQL